MKMSLKTALKDLAHGTNILDLHVPAELEKTISCGVPFMDDAMGGEGFTPSSVMLFTGTPGAGKTTFMLQMADAITGSGNVCLFNTGEESPLQVRKVTKRIGVKHGFYIGQDTKVQNILKHARALRKKHPSKQLFIVIDSLQVLDDGKYANGHTNSMTAVRCVEMLADFCKETFSICVVIGQVTKNSNVFAGKQQIKHTVDIHAHLAVDDDKKSETYGMRIFESTKNRFGGCGRSFVLDMRKTGLTEIGSFDRVATVKAAQQD
jgi:DNA repair protein RadA/Sms